MVVAMLCRNKPEQPKMYYHIMDANIVRFLMEHDCHPLYMSGNTYYFSRNNLVQKWLTEYEKSTRKEVGDGVEKSKL